MYDEFASWFHLITAPADYEQEASVYRDIFLGALPGAVSPTLLELGSGGGNNASHLKAQFRCTLTDLSPKMLAISRELNPECEHIEGDMRSLRLGRTFDCVFVHDAVTYMLTGDDLRSAIATAFAHVRPGGVALFVPDCTLEGFRARTDHGGHDGDGRSLRYVEWTHPPSPGATTYMTDFAYIMRIGGDARVELDQHVCGIFSRAQWLEWLKGAGFDAHMDSRVLDDDEPGVEYDMFVARRAG
jgi:SAM-dependent methyltransferase